MAVPPIRDELLPVLGAVELLSPNAFRFAGGPPVQADPLAAALQSTLYVQCYCHRLGTPMPATPPPDPTLVERLSAANRARDRWDPGWQVYQAGADGRIFVLKGDRQRAAVPGEYVTDAYLGAPPSVGAMVTLRVPREGRAVQPGFHHMFGEVPGDLWDESFLVRFYFHCTPQHVAELVAALTQQLNRAQVPYRMKALSDATHYTRSDAMVLYIARRYLRIVAWLVEALPPALLATLRDAVPLFTRRLRPGIGLAEDPGNGESFGMQRCRLLAEAMLSAWRLGQIEPEARLRAAKARFAADGLSLDAPWLAPGSVDVFEAGLPEGAAA